MFFSPQRGCEAKLIYKVALHHVTEKKFSLLKKVIKKNLN